MFKRVLVPLDGSMLAELAIEPALHLVQQTDGTIYLMRVPVYSDSGAKTTPDYHRDWAADNVIPEYEDVAAYLRDVRKTISRQGVTIRTTVGEGNRADAILNTAVTKDVNLIIMGSHTRSGVSRWLLGSVAGSVIRQSQSPVMLVRRASDYNHILVTLDGSQAAEHILETALAFAAGCGSRITFLQVEDQSDAAPRQPDSDKETYLETIMARCAHSGVEMSAISLKGPVAKTILSYVAQNDVDLIAMSTLGRSGFRKLIFGSVTEKVMCDSGSAMLISRPPDQDLS